MDKQEAERVAKAIHKMTVSWIAVRGVELNPLTQTYEVRCTYKQRYMRRDAAWTEVRISTPRQWIELLTHRRPDGDGLELP